MQFLPKQPKAERLEDLLCWGTMIRHDVIVTKQHEFMSVLRFVPRDMECASREQIIAHRSAMNTAVQRF